MEWFWVGGLGRLRWGPMKVLVIGANGATGFRVVRLLAEAGRHEPVAMIRDEGQAGRFRELGVETVVADLEYPLEEPIAGCDAVIFAAGSGGKTGKDKTVLIDHLAAIRSMVAALNQGARRYIMLSGLNVDRDYRGESIPHWRRAKGRADDFLRTMPAVFDGEGLDYSIVCPGRLTDNEAVSGLELVPMQSQGQTSRKILAETLVGCLDEPATIGCTFGVTDGCDSVMAGLKSPLRLDCEK